jgi:predicted nucleic acid-binding protein
MKSVFVDTSGFYALLDKTDRFHQESKHLFLRARDEKWHLITSSMVVHESWALIQARLGWEAVEDWLQAILPSCEVIWVGERLFELGSARARQARERRLSLTDCVSFETMLQEGCREAIADDEHFAALGFVKPE